MAYGGQAVTIPLGGLGLLTDVAPGDIPPSALIRANNIIYTGGTLEKAPGTRQINSTQLSDGIVGIYDWNPSSIQQRLIAVTDVGDVYRDTGDGLFSGGTAITTGLGGLTPNDVVFVEGGHEVSGNNKKLLLFTGQNQLKVLSGDGTSFADISSPAADWTGTTFPGTGIIHRNRLWAFSGQYGYASDTGDHENFLTNNLFMNIFPGEGDDIEACFSFKGRLFVFKKGNYVYLLEDTDSDSSNWYFRKVASDFGVASRHSIFEALDDMLVGNSTGSLNSMKASEKLGDVEAGDILHLAKIEEYVRNNINESGVTAMHTLYYSQKKRAYITYKSKYGGDNDRMLVMDVDKLQQPRFSFYTKDVPNCLAIRRDINGIRRPMYGSSDGYVYLMDQEDRLTHATAYTGEVITAHNDFRAQGLQASNKLFDSLSIEFIPQGNWNLLCDVYIDGRFTEQLSFGMSDQSNQTLGRFTLGGAVSGDPLGRTDTQNSPLIPLHGTGRRIAFHFKQAGSNQNFKLASYTAYFRVAGQNATRFSTNQVAAE
jgi:hypothetical protein